MRERGGEGKGEVKEWGGEGKREEKERRRRRKV